MNVDDVNPIGTADPARAAIDVGLVVRDGDAALAFYRDVLGLRHVGDSPIPAIGFSGTIHRLRFGESTLKLLVLNGAPPATSTTTDIAAATGLRYITLPVRNLTEVLARVILHGHPVAMPVLELRPGAAIAFLADPDGNRVELLQID